MAAPQCSRSCFPFRLFALLVASAFLAVGVVEAYPAFQNAIPNGHSVVHPNYPSFIWYGVGHFVPGGGGPNNQFGLDFIANGLQWTAALCKKDSDGDGRTNGDELGDPNCVWTAGQMASRTTNISHPGVCQPINSTQCAAYNAAFGNGLFLYPGFQCPTLNATNDTFAVTYQLNNTLVPTQETTYMCQAFSVLPQGDTRTVYLTGSVPIISNYNVMHHIVIYGCSAAPSASAFTTPYQCGMADPNCATFLSVWAVGGYGSCAYPNASIAMGVGLYQYIVVEMHWNNPALIPNYYDNSGMTLYFSPTPRQYNAGIMLTGNRYIEIAPGYPSINITANCTSACSTNIFSLPQVYVTSAFVHMHTTGQNASIEQWRNGVKIGDVFPWQPVPYSKPPILLFDPPIVWMKGDEMRMVCNYNTVGNTLTQYYGESTEDEMCFAFMNYFPVMAQEMCLNYGPALICGSLTTLQTVETCNIALFIQNLTVTYYPAMNKVCPAELNLCLPKCMAFVQTMKLNPCLSGSARLYLDFLSMQIPSLGVFREGVVLCENAMLLNATIMNLTSIHTAAPMTTTTGAGFLSANQLALLIAAAVLALLLLLVVVVVALVKVLCFGGGAGASQSQGTYIVSNPIVFQAKQEL